DFLFVDDTVLDQRVQVVSRGPDREAKRPRDRTEVVPGQQPQMVVDLSTNRMLESRQQTQADQETPSIRQVATARPGGRPDKHADRAERSGERVLPPPPPIHEKTLPVIHSERRISSLCWPRFRPPALPARINVSPAPSRREVA